MKEALARLEKAIYTMAKSKRSSYVAPVEEGESIKDWSRKWFSTEFADVVCAAVDVVQEYYTPLEDSPIGVLADMAHNANGGCHPWCPTNRNPHSMHVPEQVAAAHKTVMKDVEISREFIARLSGQAPPVQHKPGFVGSHNLPYDSDVD